MVDVARQALRQSPCEVHGAELRVHVPATGLFTYPDVSVACAAKFREPAPPLDTLVNPSLLIEVLAKSTEAYDRGKKFENYRSLPSLDAYVLIASDRVHIEHYTRQPGGGWLMHEVAAGGRLRVVLPCAECNISVDEIYARVFVPAA